MFVTVLYRASFFPFSCGLSWNNDWLGDTALVVTTLHVLTNFSFVGSDGISQRIKRTPDWRNKPSTEESDWLLLLQWGVGEQWGGGRRRGERDARWDGGCQWHPQTNVRRCCCCYCCEMECIGCAWAYPECLCLSYPPASASGVAETYRYTAPWLDLDCFSKEDHEGSESPNQSVRNIS